MLMRLITTQVIYTSSLKYTSPNLQNPEVSNINEPHELKLGPILGGPKFPNLSIGYHKIKLYNLN